MATSPHSRGIVVAGGAYFIGSSFVHHLFPMHLGAPSADCCGNHEKYGAVGNVRGLEIFNVDKLSYASDLLNLESVAHTFVCKFVRADIRDPKAIDKTFGDRKPGAVVYFANELHVNCGIEGGELLVRTNLLRTQVLLNAVCKHKIHRFIAISDDKVYRRIQNSLFSKNDRLNIETPYLFSKASSNLLVLAHQLKYRVSLLITRCTNMTNASAPPCYYP